MMIAEIFPVEYDRAKLELDPENPDAIRLLIFDHDGKLCDYKEQPANFSEEDIANPIACRERILKNFELFNDDLATFLPSDLLMTYQYYHPVARGSVDEILAEIRAQAEPEGHSKFDLGDWMTLAWLKPAKTAYFLDLCVELFENDDFGTVFERMCVELSPYDDTLVYRVYLALEETCPQFFSLYREAVAFGVDAGMEIFVTLPDEFLDAPTSRTSWEEFPWTEIHALIENEVRPALAKHVETYRSELTHG